MDVLAVVGVDDRPEAFASLDGVPVLVRSVRTLLSSGVAGHVTVVAPAAHAERVGGLCAELPVTVRTALDAGSFDLEVVLLHDAVRPLAPARLVHAVVDAVRQGHAAAVPVLALTDTVKRLDARGRLHGGTDREALRVVQTPVAVRADVLGTLGSVYAGAAGAVLRAGVPVHAVAGDPMAFPVRTPADLELAAAALAGMIG
jgi:2-C-methyl-D-erythritol 4-phosphate cytidylyltransferase